MKYHYLEIFSTWIVVQTDEAEKLLKLQADKKLSNYEQWENAKPIDVQLIHKFDDETVEEPYPINDVLVWTNYRKPGDVLLVISDELKKIFDDHLICPHFLYSLFLHSKGKTYTYYCFVPSLNKEDFDITDYRKTTFSLLDKNNNMAVLKQNLAFNDLEQYTKAYQKYFDENKELVEENGVLYIDQPYDFFYSKFGLYCVSEKLKKAINEQGLSPQFGLLSDLSYLPLNEIKYHDSVI